MNIHLSSSRPLLVGLSILSMLVLHACSGSETTTTPGATNPPDTSNPDSDLNNAGNSDGTGANNGSGTANKTWEPAEFAAAGLFAGVVVDPTQPTTVYAAADVSGVYRSDNGGETWSAKSTGLLSHAIADLTIDPSDNERIWAATALGLERVRKGDCSFRAATVRERFSPTKPDRFLTGAARKETS